ncbi:MAG: GNAT family N-acetyltransferase [Clostridiaceae bacterium]|nr:GNAT family N-acetyltransferase [Clostridiaceae bacterium]
MRMAEIETSRLLIRPTKEADSEKCLNIWLDEEMGKYLSDPPRDKADEDELNFATDIENQDGWYPMVITCKENGDFLGTCSVVPYEDEKCWDLGYTIHKKYWRQGYATELLLKLITVGETQGVRSFTATVAKENIGSNALLKKLGFSIWKDNGKFHKRGTDIVYEEYVYRLDLR